MKRLCIIMAALALLMLMLAMPAQADEPAKYNFATAQGSKELVVLPGGECVGYIYFYNIDGNRITHITLEVGQAPTGWEVTIEPPLTETEVLVSGMPVTVEENLYVEFSELLAEEPHYIPEDMVSIKVPGRGYTLGKVAQVLISVPESEPLGSTGEITIAGEAAWLGQSGTAAIKQARDFNFSVTVVPTETEYSETVIGPVEESEVAGSTAAVDTTTTEPNEDRAAPDNSFMTWLPVVIAVLIVGIFGGILIMRRVARNRRK